MREEDCPEWTNISMRSSLFSAHILIFTLSYFACQKETEEANRFTAFIRLAAELSERSLKEKSGILQTKQLCSALSLPHYSKCAVLASIKLQCRPFWRRKKRRMRIIWSPNHIYSRGSQNSSSLQAKLHPQSHWLWTLIRAGCALHPNLTKRKSK